MAWPRPGGGIQESAATKGAHPFRGLLGSPKVAGRWYCGLQRGFDEKRTDLGADEDRGQEAACFTSGKFVGSDQASFVLVIVRDECVHRYHHLFCVWLQWTKTSDTLRVP